MKPAIYFFNKLSAQDQASFVEHWCPRSIPEPYTLENYLMKTQFESMFDFLDASLLWHLTDQGYNYWWQICLDYAPEDYFDTLLSGPLKKTPPGPAPALPCQNSVSAIGYLV